MRNDASENASQLYWDNIYSSATVRSDDWLSKYKQLIESCNTPILDLGCGNGNNVKSLVDLKKNVIACDFSENAIKYLKKNFPEVYDTKVFNMIEGIPFNNESFDLIVADLSLHYFKEFDTKILINELYRVMKRDSYLLLRVNSVNDVNFGVGDGVQIEKNLYKLPDNRLKRFFDEEDLKKFFWMFDFLFCEEKILTRFGPSKYVYEVCLKKVKENL